jgi:hypothetical protein
MKFWKRLRWIFSLIFVVLLLLSWLGIEPTGHAPPGAVSSRNPPVFLP